MTHKYYIFPTTEFHKEIKYKKKENGDKQESTLSLGEDDIEHLVQFKTIVVEEDKFELVKPSLNERGDGFGKGFIPTSGICIGSTPKYNQNDDDKGHNISSDDMLGLPPFEVWYHYNEYNFDYKYLMQTILKSTGSNVSMIAYALRISIYYFLKEPKIKSDDYRQIYTELKRAHLWLRTYINDDFFTNIDTDSNTNTGGLLSRCPATLMVEYILMPYLQNHNFLNSVKKTIISQIDNFVNKNRFHDPFFQLSIESQFNSLSLSSNVEISILKRAYEDRTKFYTKTTDEYQISYYHIPPNWFGETSLQPQDPWLKLRLRTKAILNYQTELKSPGTNQYFIRCKVYELESNINTISYDSNKKTVEYYGRDQNTENVDKKNYLYWNYMRLTQSIALLLAINPKLKGITLFTENTYGKKISFVYAMALATIEKVFGIRLECFYQNAGGSINVVADETVEDFIAAIVNSTN